MTSTSPAAAPQKDHGRAGRNLPAAIASAVVLLAAIAASLFFWKTAFMFIVAAAVVVAVWELHRGFQAKAINLPEQPLMAGGVVMVVVAYFWGAPALVTATAVTALVTMLWLLRRGIDGYVMNATASVFTLIYVPFLGSFVALMLAEDGHPSWTDEFDFGVLLGLIAVVMATLGDLCESVIKRDLGIKDMSQVIPGHGGLMDRLDSLLATIAPIWLLLHYAVFT